MKTGYTGWFAPEVTQVGGIARWQARARRALRRPPGEVLRRLVFEARASLDRAKPAPSARFTDAAFARMFGAADMEGLWDSLATRPYPEFPARADREAIAEGAARALRLEVDLLGSGPTTLGPGPREIDWQLDFKSGHRWPLAYFRDLDLNGFGQPSDVKVPWELSRLQWLIPLGLEFQRAGDPAHARFVREVLESWIVGNPYARGANWGVAMEAAMRIFVWTWLFHVFARSEAWQARDFRGSFLRSIYDHAIFCARYLEDFGTSSNHLIADASGVAVAGMFLNSPPLASFGLGALSRALPRQLTRDGVNHEGSAPYHRLVSELVFLSLAYAKVCGIDGLDALTAQLARMEAVSAALVGPDGRLPAWGDNDDGRALPLGQSMPAPASQPRAFAEAGLYVMAGERDHVTIDCGPAGHAHGHNDALSFEAVLDGVRLITDSGSYVYTSSLEERHWFRSAAAHNAPIVDGVEPNRLRMDEPFLLSDDAKASLVAWEPGVDVDRLVGTHRGYAVRPTRTITLDKRSHRLSVRDDFAGEGTHSFLVRLHVATGATLVAWAPNRWSLGAGGKTFEIALGTPEWSARIGSSWESVRYGVKTERAVLELSRTGTPAPLAFDIYPL